MCIYWIIFFILLLFGIYYRRNSKSFYFCLFILLLMGATRAQSVGADLRVGYSMEFNSMGLNPGTWGRVMGQFEYGFQWMMANFKYYVSNDSLLFFHLLFIITFTNFLIFIHKMSTNRTLCLFFLYAFAYYFELYNGMRQQFCFSIILVSLSYLLQKPQRKNIYIFILITTLSAYFFHKSQLVLLLILPMLFFKDKITKKILILSLIISSLASIPIAKLALNAMSNYVYIFEGDNTNYAAYMQDERSFGAYSQLSNFLNTLFCIYVVYLHKAKDKTDIFLLCYVFGVILLNILTPISWIYQRIAFSFMFFRIFTYAKIWYNIDSPIQRKLYRIAVILLSVVMFGNRLVNDNNSDVLPYVNIYLGEFM